MPDRKLKFNSSLICVAALLCFPQGAGASEAGPHDTATRQSTARIYRNAQYGFEFVVPEGWTTKDTNFYFAHYSRAVLTVNSQRPDLQIRNWPTAKNTREFAPRTTFEQMQPGEAYISIGYTDSSFSETMRTDTVGNDLHSLLETNQFSTFAKGLSEMDLRFLKRGHNWFISAYMKEPVMEDNRRKMMALLESFSFVDAPVSNASWAESLAWRELPEKIRDTQDPSLNWPLAGHEQSGLARYGQRSVLVTNLGAAYSVKFTLIGIGSWTFNVATNGSVEPGQALLQALSPGPPWRPSDLPGASQGKADSYWAAPYVHASRRLGNLVMTWFTKEGRVKKMSNVVYDDPGSGYAVIDTNIAVGINEDWRVSLPRTPLSYDRYIKCTKDSRVLLDEFGPNTGGAMMDVYVHGKKVNTIGPFLPYYPSCEPALNEDGSAAILIRDNESKTNSEIVVLDANGALAFKTECKFPVWSPNVAPNGAGVLLRPNSGTSQNTFLWFTEKGKTHSLDISPNPECAGWVPHSCKALFSTQLGFEAAHFELIDWNAAKRLWSIPSPGQGQVFAIGFTPKLIILAIAEPYPPGTPPSENESVLESGEEWIRSFYAINVADGRLVARWRGQLPRIYRASDHDHFLYLGTNLFYVSADEFTELNLRDIMAKKGGWQ
jgi:hypothetical protein